MRAVVLGSRMRMMTAAKRFGLYSAFRACSVICFKFSVHPRFTVATIFLNTRADERHRHARPHSQRARRHACHRTQWGQSRRSKGKDTPRCSETSAHGRARRRCLHTGRRGLLKGRRDAVGVGVQLLLPLRADHFIPHGARAAGAARLPPQKPAGLCRAPKRRVSPGPPNAHAPVSTDPSPPINSQECLKGKERFARARPCAAACPDISRSQQRCLRSSPPPPASA